MAGNFLDLKRSSFFVLVRPRSSIRPVGAGRYAAPESRCARTASGRVRANRGILSGMRPETAEKVLSWLLLAMGGLALLAVVPMVMPTAWMVAVNDRLGLGPFPHSTLTEYLTRSLSAVYASLGALIVYLGLNVRRYLGLIVFVGWLTIALGVALTVIDFAIGMSAAWTWGEGPPTVVIGWAFIWLAGRVK